MYVELEQNFTSDNVKNVQFRCTCVLESIDLNPIICLLYGSADKPVSHNYVSLSRFFCVYLKDFSYP